MPHRWLPTSYGFRQYTASTEFRALESGQGGPDLPPASASVEPSPCCIAVIATILNSTLVDLRGLGQRCRFWIVYELPYIRVHSIFSPGLSFFIYKG